MPAWRAVELDQQTTYRRCDELRTKRTRERTRHAERAGIVAAMRIEQSLPAAKERRVRSRNPVAAVLAGDEIRVVLSKRRVRRLAEALLVTYRNIRPSSRHWHNAP